MSRTIEAIIEQLEPVKRRSMPTHAKRPTANWQNGLESGTHVQRKIRLAFANVAAHPQVN